MVAGRLQAQRGGRCGHGGMAGQGKEDSASRRRTEQTTAGLCSVRQDSDAGTGVQMGARTEADSELAGLATAAV